MSKNILEHLFVSRTRVKILKFLFRNLNPDFTVKDLSIRLQESRGAVNKEVKKLLEVGLVKIKR